MLKRCLNPHHDNFPRYGGAGVVVADRWNPKLGGSFQNFLSDLGERPAGTSLGRFGDVGNYEPNNVKWMTDAEQKIEARAKRLNKQLQQIHKSTTAQAA